MEGKEKFVSDVADGGEESYGQQLFEILVAGSGLSAATIKDIFELFKLAVKAVLDDGQVVDLGLLGTYQMHTEVIHDCEDEDWEDDDCEEYTFQTKVEYRPSAFMLTLQNEILCKKQKYYNCVYKDTEFKAEQARKLENLRQEIIERIIAMESVPVDISEQARKKLHEVNNSEYGEFPPYIIKVD